MTVFDAIDFSQHEQIVFCYEPSSELKAIIAVHNTQLGSAVGGCRMYPYSSESEALIDVLRLSRGMTYKSAMAGINAGGGKAVIIGDPKELSCENLFRAFGRMVNRLNGSYITAEDVGTTPDHMAWIRQETEHVICLPSYMGGSGNPSPVTAHGVFVGIKAALKHMFGHEDLSGIKVAVQGVGNVGYALCRELYHAGAQLFVTDIDENQLRQTVSEFEAIPVQPQDIYGLNVDVFSPCALGSIINDDTLSQLKCAIIAGSANNPLHDEQKHGQILRDRKILYAPDYVINAGGLLSAYSELEGGSREYVMKRTEEIYGRLLSLFQQAEDKGIPTTMMANQMAEQRIQSISTIRRISN